MSDDRDAPSVNDAAPPASISRANAVFFDGLSNRKRNVTLDLGPQCEVIEDGRIIASWPFTDIRRADSSAGLLRAWCVTAPSLARLEIREEALAAALIARSPKFDEHKTDRKSVARIVGWSLAAAVSIVLVVIYGVPLAAESITPLVPQGVERRIGEAVDRQVKVIFDGKVCDNAPGQAAFIKLVDALRQANGMDQSVDAAVIQNETPNAFALPGGKVYLLSALLDKAESADELAGILGHELGHVKHRDGLRNLIYTGGTSFLFGLLFGDVTGASALIFVTRNLFNASYSRQAETNADTIAIDSMLKLGRSPKPMGDLMFRITGAEGKTSIPILSNHPLTEDRQARLSSLDRPASAPPILSDSEWAALKAICRSTK